MLTALAAFAVYTWAYTVSYLAARAVVEAGWTVQIVRLDGYAERSGLGIWWRRFNLGSTVHDPRSRLHDEIAVQVGRRVVLVERGWLQ